LNTGQKGSEAAAMTKIIIIGAGQATASLAAKSARAHGLGQLGPPA
jgi:hypothetical protein